MKSSFNCNTLILITFFLAFLNVDASKAQIVIGGERPDTSAALDIQSSATGALFPRLTTVQRDAISLPAKSLIVYNMTTNCLEMNSGTTTSPVWSPLKCKEGNINLDCANVVAACQLIPGVNIQNMPVKIPFSNGNGGTLTESSFQSRGVTGLTAQLNKTTLKVGKDTIFLFVSGTPTGSGLATFDVNIGEQYCQVQIKCDFQHLNTAIDEGSISEILDPVIWLEGFDTTYNVSFIVNGTLIRDSLARQAIENPGTDFTVFMSGYTGGGCPVRTDTLSFSVYKELERNTLVFPTYVSSFDYSDLIGTSSKAEESLANLSPFNIRYDTVTGFDVIFLLSGTDHEDLVGASIVLSQKDTVFISEVTSAYLPLALHPDLKTRRQGQFDTLFNLIKIDTAFTRLVTLVKTDLETMDKIELFSNDKKLIYNSIVFRYRDTLLRLSPPAASKMSSEPILLPGLSIIPGSDYVEYFVGGQTFGLNFTGSRSAFVCQAMGSSGPISHPWLFTGVNDPAITPYLANLLSRVGLINFDYGEFIKNGDEKNKLFVSDLLLSDPLKYEKCTIALSIGKGNSTQVSDYAWRLARSYNRFVKTYKVIDVIFGPTMELFDAASTRNIRLLKNVVDCIDGTLGTEGLAPLDLMNGMKSCVGTYLDNLLTESPFSFGYWGKRLTKLLNGVNLSINTYDLLSMLEEEENNINEFAYSVVTADGKFYNNQRILKRAISPEGEVQGINDLNSGVFKLYPRYWPVLELQEGYKVKYKTFKGNWTEKYSNNYGLSSLIDCESGLFFDLTSGEARPDFSFKTLNYDGIEYSGVSALTDIKLAETSPFIKWQFPDFIFGSTLPVSRTLKINLRHNDVIIDNIEGPPGESGLPAEFSATVMPPFFYFPATEINPDTVYTGEPDSFLSAPITVRVFHKPEFGPPRILKNYEVHVRVLDGGGKLGLGASQLDQITLTTNDDGEISIPWKLGGACGALTQFIRLSVKDRIQRDVYFLDIKGKINNKPPCGAYVAPNVWKEFMCHNLGVADSEADPFTPSWAINGGYWQWGKSSMAASGPSSADNPNGGAVPGWDYANPAPNGSWSGSGPCPSGFRVPTKTEWDGVIANNCLYNLGSWFYSPTNYSSGKGFGRKLFLPAAGSRDYSDGALYLRGGYGIYWSSTEYGNGVAWGLSFNSSSAGTGSNSSSNYYSRDFGFSVRCVAE